VISVKKITEVSLAPLTCTVSQIFCNPMIKCLCLLKILNSFFSEGEHQVSANNDEHFILQHFMIPHYSLLCYAEVLNESEFPWICVPFSIKKKTKKAEIL